MKKFNDLEFKDHPFNRIQDNGLCMQAIMKFDNGYGISVLLGDKFYSNGIDTYELAILNPSGGIDYSTHITDDVLGNLNRYEVDEIMIKVQEL